MTDARRAEKPHRTHSPIGAPPDFEAMAEDLVDEMDRAAMQGAPAAAPVATAVRAAYEQGRADEMERCVAVARLKAEEIKHTRHVDGLGMGWLAGEDLCQQIADAIANVPTKEPKP
jgi:hypothetical protein